MSSASTRVDVNYLSITGASQELALPIPDLTAVDGSQYATVLKMSDGVHDLDLTGLKVPGGHETAVDLDWATNVSLRGDFGLGPVPSDNVLRVKGPFKNVKLSGFIWSYGQRNGIDIEIGNHFDQASGLGSGCDLTGLEAHMNGDRVTVAVGWVVPFTVKLSHRQEYLIWESLKLKAYVAAKHLIRLVLKIPAGTKGPSWM